VPIVGHVLKNNPADHSVRAIIVYPMNALINSQLKALQDFKERNWPGCPVTFARYTGRTAARIATGFSPTRRKSCSPTM